MLYNSTEQGVTLNELADVAATTATGQFGSSLSQIQAGQQELREAFRVARRIATVEAHIRRHYPGESTFDPDHAKMQISQAQGVKRKLDGAITNTQGATGHRTYAAGRWT